MSTVITAPAVIPETVDGPELFLAGGITNVADWQDTAISALADCPGTLYNPRRVAYDHLNPELAIEQIEWEYAALDRADAILFWFAGGESPQPITLYELGSWAARASKPLIVGVDPGYVRSIDVHTQLGLLRPGILISTTLTDLTDRAAAFLLREADRRASARTSEQGTRADVSPLGPPSDMGWTRCHGCEASFDDRGTGSHMPACSGRCVRSGCTWHAETV